MPDIPYTTSQKLLHRILLGSRIIAEFCLDFETRTMQPRAEAAAAGRHIFVSGLARSGTTILMRRLYQTGAFTSLTYRDMPFALMPGFWRRMAGSRQKSMERAERAHGDGILVDYDSPEAFEEIFWRVCEGPQYIHKDRILPHRPTVDTLEKFKRYIAAILASREKPDGRYLSKNNNNIIRLPALCAAFQESLFLVPFRRPLQHAWSLLNQHRRFARPDDTFTTDYMRWLGHHEFGADHRPFRFADAPNPHHPDQLAYWLFLWDQVYRHLLDSAPGRVRFVCYEMLCSDAGVTWRRILEAAGMPESAETEDPLRLVERDVDYDGPQDLLDRARETYGQMMERV